MKGEALLRLQPVFHEKIWGGKQLREKFGYPVEGDNVGECWGISGHPNGDCALRGSWEGHTLSDLWQNHRDLFGNLPGEVFPLLVKVLDAQEDLSVQVHPDDAYAAEHENGSLGKTECWYVLDCEPGTTIIIGHKCASREELAEKVAAGKWEEILREVPIHKGDFFQIDPGCLHAIKGGTLILETQQSSDVTYRFYDYGRLADGKPRPLHIAQSLAVTQAPFRPHEVAPETTVQDGAEITCLVRCPCYSVYHISLNGAASLDWQKPFVNVSVIGGEGALDGLPVCKGDHLIVPSGYGMLTMTGNLELICSHV